MNGPTPIDEVGTGPDLLERVVTHAGMILAMLVIVSAICIIGVPILQARDNFDHRNEARRIVIQICGGLFAVLGFSLAIVRIRHTQRDIQLKESAERSSRYLKCAEMLGSIRVGDSGGQLPNIESRLGAIYALEKFAEDSGSDYPTVVRLLAQYIRMHARSSPIHPPPASSDQPLKQTPISEGPLDPLLDTVRFDVQTAIQVIVKAPPKDCSADRRINLRGAFLKDLRLDAANFQNATLDRVSLAGAELEGANLQHASLVGAVLSFANLANASLQGANLTSSDLIGSDLTTAHFDRGTVFHDADLSKCKFFIQGKETEQSRGLDPNQLLETRNWDTAEFSLPFRQELGLLSRTSAPE